MPPNGESMVHPYLSLRLWIGQNGQDPHQHDACLLIVVA